MEAGIYTTDGNFEQKCRAIAVKVQGQGIDIALAERITEDFVRLIESEIKQARLAEAERAPHGNDCLSFNHDRSATGLDCSCARGKRIAQLSSVQQEGSELGRVTLNYPVASSANANRAAKKQLQQEVIPEDQCPHGYMWGDCAKCPPPVQQEAPRPVNEFPTGFPLHEVPAAAPTEQEAPPKTCKICGGIGENHVDTIERRDDDTAAPTNSSGERQREQVHIELQLRVKPNDPIQYHEATLTIGRVHKICDGIHICASVAPQQTTAAQRGEK